MSNELLGTFPQTKDNVSSYEQVFNDALKNIPKEQDGQLELLAAEQLPYIELPLRDQDIPTGKVENYLELVREVEQTFGPAERKRTSFMITQFRKAYYRGTGWDHLLLPGSQGIELNIPKQYVDRLCKEESRNVELEAGPPTDVSHTLVGMDAAKYLGTLPSGVPTDDASTWLGDLGSILGELFVLAMRGKSSGTPEEQWKDAIDRMCPGVDSWGNIDGLVLMDELNSGRWKGELVSDILEAYYVDQQAPFVERVEHFTQRIGLGKKVEQGFTEQDPFIRARTPQVQACAVFYIGSRAVGLEKQALWAPAFLSRTAARHVLQAFVRMLAKASTTNS